MWAARPSQGDEKKFWGVQIKKFIGGGYNGNAKRERKIGFNGCLKQRNLKRNELKYVYLTGEKMGASCGNTK